MLLSNPSANQTRLGGRWGLVPGLCTGALACTLLQWTYNELGVARVKYVSRSEHLQIVSTHRSASDPVPPGPPKSWSETFLDFIGIYRIPDEELLVKMKAARLVLLGRIEG